MLPKYSVWASMGTTETSSIIGGVVLGGLLIVEMVRKLILSQLFLLHDGLEGLSSILAVSPESQLTDPTRDFFLTLLVFPC